MNLAAPLLLLALASPMVKVERYRLQSNFWVNLHQRLLYEARFKEPPPKSLTPEEGAIWEVAVGAYREFLGNRSPIFDRELIAMNAALSATRGDKLPETIPKPAREALLKTMSLYKKDQWPRDDLANRFWISVAEPMLASTVAELLAAHEKAYGMPFPKHILVDVAAFGWEFGAYTVGDAESVHCVIQSNDPASQGYSALESLMHEPAHGIVEAEAGAIGADLASAARKLNLKPRHNLWHALLFFTAGDLTRRALAPRGVDYKPLIYWGGFFDRQFAGFKEPLETYWRAYLEGTMPRAEAMEKILLATAKPAE